MLAEPQSTRHRPGQQVAPSPTTLSGPPCEPPAVGEPLQPRTSQDSGEVLGVAAGPGFAQPVVWRAGSLPAWPPQGATLVRFT